ncbi:hypothetical protein QVD17_11058 [Tagetes erecta]|uniref:Avr9/Cf-9 rapidly elicited protein 146 n=1 Tax=Tagetes erecta TaxID=13708 RepID=A0AAD8LAJ8_TARER|nr:hypothetical protein QVD17_11058 [Tagetes erecta]
MEQNPPILAKKVWNLIRVVYSMLRKGISKRKILLDLNMMIKRGKIASKTLHNIMFHHHHHHHHHRHNTATNHLSFSSPTASESEFSCTQSPVNEPVDDIDMRAASVAVMKAMEMIEHSENASPPLHGFGGSPVVRQLRVTDSPYPVNGVDEDSRVDEDAERFISRFYDDLRRQNTKGSFGSC